MRRVLGLIFLLLVFTLTVSAQDATTFTSEDGLLTFDYPSDWEMGEAAFEAGAYSVPFTLPNAQVTIKVIDVSEDTPEAFLSAQREASEGGVREFDIGEFAAVSSALTSGEYQIAFALNDTHVAVAVIEAESSDVALEHEPLVAEVLASLRFGMAQAEAATIESPVLNITLPSGWASISNQLQGDYFQFGLRPVDETDERYILIEFLDLAPRGLADIVRSEGVGTLMSQLPGGDSDPETLTLGGFDLVRAVGFNESTSRYVAYTLFVVEDSWLVAISAGALTEEDASALIEVIDEIVVEMEDGINLTASALEGILAPTIEGAEYFPGFSAEHRQGPVEYAETPPAGGPHNPVWQTCGVYDAPLKNEHAVHSMEHGTVWITYQPDLPADEVEVLANFTRRGTHRLLSPYPGIDSPIIISAWGYQLRLESSDDPRLLEFFQTYEQGATTPELGATCSGGETRVASQLQ